MCSVCGEESSGTGSDHVREKDGIWAVLAWMSILDHKNKDNLSSGKLVTVADILCKHWETYGRHYYTRYDYENVDAGAVKELVAHLVKLQSSIPEVNKIVKEARPDVSNVLRGDEFEYKDPVDGSISKNQGIRYFFEYGSRLMFRLWNRIRRSNHLSLHRAVREGSIKDWQRFTRSTCSSGGCCSQAFKDAGPVRKGTNGGVTKDSLLAAAAWGSLIGLTFALLGFFTAKCPTDVALKQLLAIPLSALAGLCGSLIDSSLGATLKFSGFCSVRKKIVGKPGPIVKKISCSFFF